MISLVEFALGAVQFAKSMPWQAWAIAGALIAIGVYGCQQHEQGEASALIKTERKQQEAADGAHKEVDRVLRGDRSHVMQFDRD